MERWFAHLYLAILNRGPSFDESEYICIVQNITDEFAREQEMLESERHREDVNFLKYAAGLHSGSYLL